MLDIALVESPLFHAFHQSVFNGKKLLTFGRKGGGGGGGGGGGRGLGGRYTAFSFAIFRDLL